MILPDHEIAKLARSGMIEPFNESQVQPSSYDVRLGRFIRVAKQSWHEVIDLNEPAPDWTTEVDLDADEDDYGDYVPEFRRGYVLRPGECALGSTIEAVAIPDNLCCRVDGKSSLARYFLQIHSAGFVDPGYQGNITLEIVNFGPRSIRLRHNCLIAQLEFMRLNSPAERAYSGRYQGSKGTVSSRYNSVIPPHDVRVGPDSRHVVVKPSLLQDMQISHGGLRYLTDPT